MGNARRAAVEELEPRRLLSASPTPAAPDLLPACDSLYSDDNYTFFNNSTPALALQFNVGGTVYGATVNLYLDGVAVASAVAPGGSTVVTTDGSSAFADGIHVFTAEQTLPGMDPSAASAQAPAAIDTTAPTASLEPGAAAVAGTRYFNFVIDYADAIQLDVDSLYPAVVLLNGPNGISLQAEGVQFSNGKSTYRVLGPGGFWNSQDNGTYTVTLAEPSVNDTAGNAVATGEIGTVNVNLPFAYQTSFDYLAADFSVPGSTLTVARVGGNYEITQGATTYTFPATFISRIFVFGTSGADTLNFSNAYPEKGFDFDRGGGGQDNINVLAGGFLVTPSMDDPANPLAISVAPGAIGFFQGNLHLRSLTVDGDAACDGQALTTRALSIGPAGTLRVDHSAVIVDYDDVSPVGTWNGSAYDNVTGYVASGRNGGSWNGHGITSSYASGNFHVLGVAEASHVLGIAGQETALFAGETVDASTVLVKFTYAGDADLSGHIDVDDYGRIDLNAPLHTSGWFNGDFNYDGKIDVDDYGIIDFNLGIQGSLL